MYISCHSWQEIPFFPPSLLPVTCTVKLIIPLLQLELKLRMQMPRENGYLETEIHISLQWPDMRSSPYSKTLST